LCCCRFLHKEYTADVYEDAIMGTFVVQIEGRSISSLLYEITDGNQDDAFLINPSTGIVTVSRGGLDYEANKNYNLSVQAMNMVISLLPSVNLLMMSSQLCAASWVIMLTDCRICRVFFAGRSGWRYRSLSRADSRPGRQ
jgi:hypothetical protein